MIRSLLNKKTFLYIIGLLLLVLFIEILSITKNNNVIFPGIGDIFKELFNYFKSDNSLSILKMLIRIIISISISLCITLIIVILNEINNNIIFIFKPILSVFKSTPIVIASLFVWLLIDAKIGLYIVCIISILPIMVDGIISSINNIPEKYIKIYKLEPCSLWTKLFKIKLPLISSNILLVIIQVLGLAIKVSIVSEYIYQLTGSIGKNLKFAYDYADMAKLLAIGFIIVVFEIVLEVLISIIKKRIEKNTLE